MLSRNMAMRKRVSPGLRPRRSKQSSERQPEFGARIDSCLTSPTDNMLGRDAAAPGALAHGLRSPGGGFDDILDGIGNAHDLRLRQSRPRGQTDTAAIEPLG